MSDKVLNMRLHIFSRRYIIDIESRKIFEIMVLINHCQISYKILVNKSLGKLIILRNLRAMIASDSSK